MLALETTVTTPSSSSSSSSSMTSTLVQDLINGIWFAVPKRKVSPGKKRMKTTLQNRIRTKSHVIMDGRTGEYTLRHCLPWNWKDYLPSRPENQKK